MVVLNATYALASAIASSMRSDFCSAADVSLLAEGLSEDSGVEMFNCLVDFGTAYPSYCDLLYSNMTPRCVTCTMSQMSDAVVHCLDICNNYSDSESCTKCKTTFLSDWTAACTQQLRSSIPFNGSVLCYSVELSPLRDEIATQLSVCLSVNETRAIDCMTNNGFVDLPNSCGNCLFASQFITNTVCHSLCEYRPYSGLCKACINAYVSNSIRMCFILDSYEMIPGAPCTTSDLGLIGPSGLSVDPVLAACTDSVSCLASRAGYLVPGRGTISNNCIQCLHVGETRSENSCSDHVCSNMTTDCAFAPSIDSMGSNHCTREDVAAFNIYSPLFRSINDCLFKANDRTTDAISECLGSYDDTALNTTLTPNCRTCMDGFLANTSSCVYTCTTYGNQTAVCQECLGSSMSYALSSCFGNQTHEDPKSCSLTEVTRIAFEPWSIASLQRCLLTHTFSNVPECLESSGLGPSSGALADMTFDCQNCLSQYLIQKTECPSVCETEGPDSNACRLCATNSMTGMLQLCTRNASLVTSNDQLSKGISLDDFRLMVAFATILISIL